MRPRALRLLERDAPAGTAAAATAGGRAAPTGDRRLLAEVAAAWLVTRALVVLTFLVATVVADAAGPLRPSALEHLDRALLGWDAERYAQIADQGYAALPGIELRFFPLVPLVARALAVVLPGDVGVALLLQANVAAFALAALAARLALQETGDRRVARAAAWLALVTPAGFVTAWGYTEPLWGCLTVGMVLALRRGRWGVAATAGLLAGLARPVAPLLVLPALVEAARGVRQAGAGERIRRAVAVLSPVVGVATYLVWVGLRFGNPLLPYTIQQGPRFRGAVSDPLHPLLQTAERAWREGHTVSGLRVFWAAVLVAAVVVAFRRWPLSFALFGAATLVVALSTERLGSFERYGFFAFPVVLAIAGVCARGLLVPAVAANAGAMVAYGTLALLGGYTP